MDKLRYSKQSRCERVEIFRPALHRTDFTTAESFDAIIPFDHTLGIVEDAAASFVWSYAPEDMECPPN